MLTRLCLLPLAAFLAIASYANAQTASAKSYSPPDQFPAFPHPAATAAPSTCLEGVINVYTPVLGFGCDSSTLRTGALTGFVAGDEVLIIQMQVAQVDLSNTAAFGTPLEPACLGNYELNRIAAVTGANEVRLLYRPARGYDVAGRVQLVRVPEYDDAEVCAVTCPPWNGETGGVLALDVKNNLTLQADVDVSGRGFRGGALHNAVPWVFGRTDYSYPPDSSLAAAKGEGVVMLPTNHAYGRGRAGTGGGGGNAHNAGGGGGGNGGAGGSGGLELCNLPAAPTPGTNGLGGLGLFAWDETKLLPGGGGGAGHSNDSLGSGGGAGGGIIYLRAGTLLGQGFRLRADGVSVDGGFLHKDGQGGGGGGGTIALMIGDLADTLFCEARGGHGGSCPYDPDFQLHGPGGGGAGGKVIAPTQFPTLLADVNGGASGLTSQSLAHGAEPGALGALVYGLPLIEATVPAGNALALPVALTPPACAGAADGTIEVLYEGEAIYRLGNQPFQPSPFFDGLAAGTYDLLVELPGGCVVDTVLELMAPEPVTDTLLARLDETCQDAGLLEVAGRGGTPPFEFQLDGAASWQSDGVFTGLTGGTAYSVTVRDTRGCTHTSVYDVAAPVPLVLELNELRDATCAEPAGLIAVTASGGAGGGYTYALDGHAPQAGGFFDELAPGKYRVVAADSTGCQAELTPLTIENLIDTALTVETVVLYAEQSYTLPDGRRTDRPGRFEFKYQTVDGCDSLYIVEIEVLPRHVYVPNAFSPGSASNGIFTVYADEKVAAVSQLAVYDRWGALVFEAHDLAPNDESRGWNGTSRRGRTADSGTYVWFAEIEFTDGLRKKYRGDVTIVR
jgi:hypothetical protein